MVKRSVTAEIVDMVVELNEACKAATNSCDWHDFANMWLLRKRAAISVMPDADDRVRLSRRASLAFDVAAELADKRFKAERDARGEAD